MWDFRSGDVIKEFNGHKDIVLSLALHKKNNLLASGGYDDLLIVWNLNGEKIK